MNAKQNQRKLAVPVGPRDHIQGLETAPITLVEYGDFECPHSQRAVDIVQEIQARLGDRVRFVFRHFPLTQKHPHAQQASEAAEAAAAQGKFWEMYQMLFENQYALDEEDLVSYAEALDLDPDHFERELEGHVHAERVKEDVRSGLDSGATGTPEFYVNGLLHSGDYDIESLWGTIQRTGLV
ncbi:MAG: DsbA family protein [Nitrospirae bacterium]|nr:DsbA family protein [Candidatus Manganitrophaceae bacterium]